MHCLVERVHTDEDGNEQQAADNLAILDVAKNRNGPPGGVPLTFLPELMRFETSTMQIQPDE